MSIYDSSDYIDPSSISDINSEPNRQITKNSGRKKHPVWDFFDQQGIQKHGHVGCICKECGWKRKVGKAYEMVEHLALTCSKVEGDVKNRFLQELRERKPENSTDDDDQPKKKQKKLTQSKITSKFESTAEIDSSKAQRCNRALTRLFICCGIPFKIVSNPFFIDFINCLCPSYQLPNRNTLAGPWVNQELSQIVSKIMDDIRESDNITLGFDGWTSTSGASIYAFILNLPSGKEYIYSLEDLSIHSHTAEFISKKIIEIVNTIGAERVSSVVSDNARAMQKAKELVNKKYNHIISIRCIAHHVNLLTTDIMKHKYSKEIIMKCMKIVKFFRHSHQSNALLSKELEDALINGGGLKGYCKTRWTTAWDCLEFIRRCEAPLHNFLENNSEVLSTDVKLLLKSRLFFQDVEELIKIVRPIKEVITSLEFKTTTLTDCFIQLIKLSVAVKTYQTITNSDFRNHCLERFNFRWNQFDFKIYMLAYFFHPLYRGKGFKDDVFRQVCYTALELWKPTGGTNSADKLIGQMLAYSNYKKPYEFEYVPGFYDVRSWWIMVKQKENWIQQLALKIHSITPHNAGCERIFSVLGWMCSKRRSRLSVERMQSMAKLHSYYVTNASTEMSYAHTNLTDSEFYKAVNESFGEFTDFSDDEIDEQEYEFEEDDDDDSDLFENDKENPVRPELGNEIVMENYFNFDDEDLRKALEIEVRVVIEQQEVVKYDHGTKDYDIDALLNANIKLVTDQNQNE